jgi:hypothetical protein
MIGQSSLVRLVSFLYPNPDKLSRSQLSSDPAARVPAKPKSRFNGELKICCIARAAQALAPRVALFFQFSYGIKKSQT